MGVKFIGFTAIALAGLFGGSSMALAAAPQYAWVAGTTPPANVVTAPDGGKKAVCRGTGDYNRMWAGYWNGTKCVGSYSGNVMPAPNNVQFLTLVTGATQWVSGTGKVIPSDIGQVPANTINAGPTYTGYQQVLCSQAGYVGWIYSNQCAIGASGLSGSQNSTVLVGTVQ